jgi:hypothetical protein
MVQTIFRESTSVGIFTTSQRSRSHPATAGTAQQQTNRLAQRRHYRQQDHSFSQFNLKPVLWMMDGSGNPSHQNATHVGATR